MKATELAYLSILSGQADCVVAGGLEIMSRPPFLLSLRNGIGNKVKDSFDLDGFPDAVTKETPIVIADKFCRDFGYSREELDEYARFSIEKAHKAKKEMKFTEVVEISLPKSQKVKNDYFRPLSAVDNSKPVHKNGFNTPGNSCGLSDGASFLVLSSRSKAIREGWKVLASILSFSDAEQHASLFPSTPTLATEKALKKAGILINQIDFMEINEPFACVVLHNSKMLKFPLNKINIYGGAISMGHPVGSSGCRIIGTLTSILKKEGGTFGVASICNAGGGGSAVVLKRE
jgi:acetyl-CoA C-acetyltransferase